MILLQSHPIAERVVRDSLALVFRDRVYGQEPVSLWDQILTWLRALLFQLAQWRAQPAVVIALKAALVFTILLAIAWIALEISTKRDPRRAPARRAGAANDPWEIARRLAAAGQYTEAAHALYAALLTTVARRGYVALHESKTTGDYIRELRPKANRTVSQPFIEFTRSYETVVYGLGACDADRYASLHALAISIAETGAAA